ncbi:hypothetical protein HLV39_13560 [Marinobacter adhaerens]|uniref:Uncharacterized protein n=1 Tax=Marinobacter adhaerens TaxID=1033846 RepID=A0A851HU03_9GAMM|nr:hypothetical protein [Marinobacter adhaerens]NWN92517.1 hypothetical protein [Marinobacter adhaerens]
MIIRIFVLLLVLNAATFIVRAEASEHPFGWPGDAMTTEEVYELQQRVSGEFEKGNADALAEISSRLISLSLVRNRGTGKHYASQPAQADHGIALLDEGASLNLKWNF